MVLFIDWGLCLLFALVSYLILPPDNKLGVRDCYFPNDLSGCCMEEKDKKE